MARQQKNTDGRRKNGGARPGAGRKPKWKEEELIDRLKKMDETAHKALENGLKRGDYNYWQKFMEYRYGKVKERVDITTGDESFNKPIISFFKTNKKN